MAQARRRPSRTEVLRQRAGTQFVGRRAQLALFAENLAKDPDPGAGPDPADFLFHVRGVGGIGKSTLLAQWRQTAQQAGALTALVDETSVHSVESALGELVRQLAQQAGPLKDYDKALEQYQRTVATQDRALEQPPAAGEVPLPVRLATKAALGAASALPGGGVVTAMADPDAVAQGADRVIEKLRHRRRERGSEESALGRAFIAELGRLCDRAQHPWIVLFFDTWEIIGRYLDTWLRDALEGTFGELPLEVIFVLAGRDELGEREWAQWRSAVVDVPLEVFTEQEARDLLAARGVTDPGAVDAILHVSMRLPLLVALLAQAKPDAAQDVTTAGADLVDQAVERFLQWIPEPERREMVVAAALPLQLNQDLFSCAAPDAGQDAWKWLLEQPFVSGHGDFKQYHAVVRASMLRLRRTHAPHLWMSAHTRLADTHSAARNTVEQHLRTWKRYSDTRWRQHLLNETYHLLCADASTHLPKALEHIARTAGEAPDSLAPWGSILVQAARDTDDPELTQWARSIHTALTTEQQSLGVLSALTAANLPSQVRAWALAHRGYTYFLADRDDEALIDLDQAVSLAADIPQALAYRGRLHSWHKRHDLALADLTAAITMDPEYAWALGSRGEAHRLAGRLDEAIADFTAALNIDPEYAWALGSRGDAHRLAGQFDQAIADFTTAIAMDPEYAWALGSRGQTHRFAGRFDEAIADFTAALNLDPEYAWALGSRGEAHRLAGRFDEAIADLTAALDLNPQYAWALAQRGEARRLAGRFDEAIADFTAALAMDPEYAWALVQRGEAHRLAGRLDEAIDDSTAALNVDPEYAWALASRGEARRLAGRLDEAIADLTAALNLNPEYAWALASRGEAHQLAGRLDQAIDDLIAAINLNPESAWMRCSLASVYRQSGRLHDARSELSEAARLAPTDTQILLEEAMLQLLESGPSAAVDAWNTFFEAPPEDTFLDPVLSAVKKLLYGLAVRSVDPEALVREFRTTPYVQSCFVDVRAYVADLSHAGPPVGPRAAAAASLLEQSV